MLNYSDCDFRIASHAHQIARVNAVEWMCPARPSVARTTPRVRLGSALMSLGGRLAPTTADAS